MLACLTQCGAAKTFAATFTDHFSDNYLATGAKCEVWQRRLKDHLGAPPGRVAWTMAAAANCVGSAPMIPLLRQNGLQECPDHLFAAADRLPVVHITGRDLDSKSTNRTC